MYITGVENVIKAQFVDGDWVLELHCGAVAKTAFLSADTDMVYLSDKLALDCPKCPEKGKSSCLVTKIERTKDESNTDE